MSNIKVVFIENNINEPSYENYKKMALTMLEKKDELRSGLPFAMECTIQEVLDKDLTKTQFSLLGLSKKKEIQLDIDLYPEFDDIEANQLEELLSTREDLKNKFQIEKK